MEMNFEGFEIQKWNILMDRAQTQDLKNGHMPSCHIYSQSFGH